jgi:PIN domain nuclease of toxin-antitoxin system
LNLLLDTHVFLWWRLEDARLTRDVRAAIGTADRVHVSVASAWEAAIKESLGRIKVTTDFEPGIAASGFLALSVTFAHARIAANLPHLHGDPFDRMLIAQALGENLTLVSADWKIWRYAVPLLRA